MIIFVILSCKGDANCKICSFLVLLIPFLSLGLIIIIKRIIVGMTIAIDKNITLVARSVSTSVVFNHLDQSMARLFLGMMGCIVLDVPANVAIAGIT